MVVEPQCPSKGRIWKQQRDHLSAFNYWRNTRKDCTLNKKEAGIIVDVYTLICCYDLFHIKIWSQFHFFWTPLNCQHFLLMHPKTPCCVPSKLETNLFFPSCSKGLVSQFWQSNSIVEHLTGEEQNGIHGLGGVNGDGLFWFWVSKSESHVDLKMEIILDVLIAMIFSLLCVNL